MPRVALLVLAKAPLPGRAKTRLCPPCSSDEAARLAEAALLDTLEVVSKASAGRKVLVFDGDPQRWRPQGFDVIAQRGDGLADRLAAAFADTKTPALLVGMDTPQLTEQLLADGISALERPDVDAVLGPALDGGYWSVGLKQPNRAVFAGVPMSVPATWQKQRARIEALGLRLHEQAPLRDIDTIADAHAVAADAPGSRFAAALAEVR
jgi:rSAM/selenodomain-associated transferase 1